MIQRALRKVAVWLLITAVIISLPGVAHAQARVGHKAPWFKLQSFTGQTFTNRSILGRPAMLVAGRTRESAPPCKDWMLALLKHGGRRLQVLQVIVSDTPWYLPRSLVRKMIKDFTPKGQLHRVLVEWYTVFADVWGIPENDLPTVFVLDAQGIVRWRYMGKLSRINWERARAALKKLPVPKK